MAHSIFARSFGRIGCALLFASCALFGASSKSYADDVAPEAEEFGHRKGGQFDVMLGMSACIPGKGACSPGEANTGGPLFGFGANFGYRIHRHFFLGTGYSLGFFGPGGGSATYNRGFQNSVLAVIRGYLPAGRFDFGFEASPGWSRVSFKSDRTNLTTYSEGFALRPGVSADYWIGHHIFLGIRADTIINIHRKVCDVMGDRATCDLGEKAKNAAVNSFIGGLHVGGTF